MVGEVITNIENNAHFTFDFLMLLVLAALIAFIGLLESSSIVLVASMLISPLMGPILAGVFGAVVIDSKLRNLGIVNELISLFICILIGMKVTTETMGRIKKYLLCSLVDFSIKV